jgi:hypothetical protein
VTEWSKAIAHAAHPPDLYKRANAERVDDANERVIVEDAITLNLSLKLGRGHPLWYQYWNFPEKMSLFSRVSRVSF